MSIGPAPGGSWGGGTTPCTLLAPPPMMPDPHSLSPGRCPRYPGICWGKSGPGTSRSCRFEKSLKNHRKTRSAGPPRTVPGPSSGFRAIRKSMAFSDPPMALSDPPSLGPSWGHVGPCWGHIGTILGHPGAILGSSCGRLGPSWGSLGPSWGHLGTILAPSWGHLEKNLAFRMFFNVFDGLGGQKRD